MTKGDLVGEVLSGDFDLDGDGVESLGNEAGVVLVEDLGAVDHLGHFLGDTELGVLRFEDEHDLAVLDVVVSELGLESAALEDPALGEYLVAFDGDVALGEGKYLAIL